MTRCGQVRACAVRHTENRVAAYLAEERRRDPHSVVKKQTLPSDPFHGALRALVQLNQLSSRHS